MTTTTIHHNRQERQGVFARLLMRILPMTPQTILQEGQIVWTERDLCWNGTRFVKEWQQARVVKITPSPYAGEEDILRVYVEALDSRSWTDYALIEDLRMSQPESEAAQ